MKITILDDGTCEGKLTDTGNVGHGLRRRFGMK
jgi:hypothetical protein